MTTKEQQNSIDFASAQLQDAFASLRRVYRLQGKVLKSAECTSLEDDDVALVVVLEKQNGS